LKQQKALQNKITYRNQGLKKKIFKPGQIVLQRNLQLATGPGKAMQPKYNGPYVVISIDKDEASALIEHVHTGQQVRAHFSNISLLNFLPQFHRSPGRYDEELLKFIPEKYSYEKYHSKTRKPTKPPHLDTPTVATPPSSSMDGNVSTSQDSNPTQLAETADQNDFEDFTTDFDSIPAQQKDNVIVPSILKHKESNPTQPKENIIVPSILKQKNAPNVQPKSTVIVPQLLKQTTVPVPENSENRQPVILPRFEKPDRKRTSKKLVATPPIIVPSIIRDIRISLPEDMPTETQRRSSRTKKPPDKLRY
jgi:hypothetical protein